MMSLLRAAMIDFNRSNRRIIPLFLCLMAMGQWGLLGQAPMRLSAPFQYEGYSKPEYKDYQKHTQYVKMSDGTDLAVDIYLPDKGPERESFPVVFVYTPYNRSYLVPKMGVLRRVGSWIAGFGWGPTFEPPAFSRSFGNLLEHGYAFVVADMRGTGASFGSQMPLMPTLGRDGKEIIDWIDQQAWCDGHVGMVGPSYLGWSQFATAGHKPEALKCIMPEVVPFDTYAGGTRPGGIPATRWLEGYSDRLEGFNQNYFNFKARFLPAVPVVDEDGDGKIQDEYPLMSRYGLMRGFAPEYKDEESRGGNLYYRATREHLDNVRVREFLKEGISYWDSEAPVPYSQYSFRHTSASYFLDEIRETGLPVYHVGGWFDGFTRGTTKLFTTLSETNPVHMNIGPRIHFQKVPKPFAKYLDYSDNYEEQLAIEHLRFLDHYLKGVDNGIDTELPVNIYVMHKGWKQAQSWPLTEAVPTTLYFGNSANLSEQMPDVSKDTYEVDFEASSSYGRKGFNRWLMYESGPDEFMFRTEADERCMTYETPAFEQDMEVTGHPIVRVWVSSDQADGDLFVYLSDVDERGESAYVTEGQLRLNWAMLRDDDDQVDRTFDVLPDLPWHGFKQEQELAHPLADGRIIEVVLDLQPIAWNFRKGHKLRISIAGADEGNFELNPDLCPGGRPEDCLETRLFIHKGGSFPSSIELPVIPGTPRTAER
ncbi:CocE/NonD family hydrolase [Pontibacter sp. G13]|uniref:CocE/NonD family hydrolase n=1 Tax=Pontibacter sp. G13 TaxID=3074898 RepID=UPI00288BDC5D|nr:CocE/NonD family hydrolase [Pontibacter sp. G13]WNJ18070.1 CocE/NonD family hydrolase [Pontibacter sp. G13]